MDKHELFQQFVRFTTAVHQTTHDLTKNVKPALITPMQYSILEYIAVSQPVTLSQISDCIHMSLPNTSRELKKLTEKQLCKKYIADDDKRKYYIQLTDKGEAMMQSAFRHIEASFLRRIEQLSEEELLEIGQALNLLRSKVFTPRLDEHN